MIRTTNFELNKPEAATDNVDIDVLNENMDTIDAALGSTAIFEAAAGTGTNIILTSVELTDGHAKNFIAAANNNGGATTINDKPLYKPGTTAAPTLITGKAYTIWYSVSGGCFFIKASAEGNAVAADVLANKTFSNDNDTGLTGTIPSKAAQTYNPSTTAQTIPAGQYLSGAQTIAATTGTAAAGDVLATKTFNSANGIGLTGSMVNRSGAHQFAVNYDGLSTPGRIYVRPPAGFYDAGAMAFVTIDDPNYIGANILSGKSIFGLAGAAQAGKRYVSGTVTSSHPSYASFIYFYPGSAGTAEKSYVTVSGLTFKPSVIVVLNTTIYTEQLSCTMYVTNSAHPGKRCVFMDLSGYEWDTKDYNSTTAAYVTSTGFCLPVALGTGYPAAVYNWFAWE